MKRFLKHCLAAACALTAAAVSAETNSLCFDGGGDIRARYEWKNNFPDKGKTTVSPDYADYLRFRPRLWGKVSYEDYTVYTRLADEFRYYRRPLKDRDKNKFPDEIFLDNLYFEAKNIGDRVDLRVGRQDIKEGSGRVVSDGTPGDSSRSAYFNAILAKVHFLEKSDVDLMGTWNTYRDELTVFEPNDIWDLTKIKSGDPYSEMDEQGAMAYLHYNEIKDFPIEGYAIWKRESQFYSGNTRYPGRQFGTFGTRLAPKFNERFSAETEAALQAGRVDSRPILAGMLYGGASYTEPTVFSKPKLTAACLYLSGDKDSYYKTADGSTDNGWNPTFNRTTWFSEICSGMYDQLRWSNLVYPHMELKLTPVSKHKISFQCGPMFAAERDNDADSSYRGFYTQARYDFPLISGIFGKRGDLSGALVAENLQYGDYYDHDSESAATWVRCELNAKF